MTKKIFKTMIIVVVFVSFLTITLFMGVQYDYFLSSQQSKLVLNTNLLSDYIQNNNYDGITEFIHNNINVYVLDSEKNVIYSTDSNCNIEEVSDKLDFDSEDVHYERVKLSVFENLLICGKAIDNQKSLIVTETQSSTVKLLIEMTYPIILIIMFAIIISLFLSFRVSQKIVKPLNDIDLNKPMTGTVYYELEPMIKKLEIQRNKLKKREIELQYKHDEFEIVTENLNEGLILININGDILSINKAAADIFKLKKDIRQNINNVKIDSNVITLINESYEGKSGEIIIDHDTGKYQVDISPVFSDNSVEGVVILIFNVTEKENSEKMRREFSANVSHELKTPLQSISGYAELLKHGLVRAEDITVFGSKIYSEAHRMINLIEDIIHLSSLDEGAGEMPRSIVDLFCVANEVADNLTQEAENMNVTINVEGESVQIFAIPHLITGIIFNLCDNAIKYSKNGGFVKISVSRTTENAIISVCDNGIGIPQEDFSRIFERFYRVDKSHSKEVGGTGLGLSIVKHAAIIHNAKIDLKSTLNVGTEITVSFPI